MFIQTQDKCGQGKRGSHENESCLTVVSSSYGKTRSGMRYCNVYRYIKLLYVMHMYIYEIQGVFSNSSSGTGLLWVCFIVTQRLLGKKHSLMGLKMRQAGCQKKRKSSRSADLRVIYSLHLLHLVTLILNLEAATNVEGIMRMQIG